MRLVNLRGLGYENYLKLEAHGITSVGDLGGLDETALSRMLAEKNS
jgi:nucleotidyltransferase/DNA polymerase involved in DNA repair